MKIRKATLKDVVFIDSLNKEFFHEEGRNWKKLVSSRDSEMFLLEFNKIPAGFTGIEYHNWNNTAKVINIFVHPDHRNKGYGKRLVKFLIAHLKDKKYRSLIAEAPSLSPVLSTYLKNGFRVCGFNDRYYSNTNRETAIFLSYDF